MGEEEGRGTRRGGGGGWRAFNKALRFLPVTICLLLEHFIIITTGMVRLQYRHSKYNPESMKCYQMSFLLHHPGHC